jgi:predicted  nucleic acid-binding Zn-ribbon protein
VHSLVKFKGCKRCGGNLFLERDSDGIYATCLQCGAVYLRHINREVPPKETGRSRVLTKNR